LADGEVGSGAGLDGVGLLAAEQGGAVVLVPLGVAHGEDEVGAGDAGGGVLGAGAELLEEVQEVVGVGAGGVEADDEGDRAVPPGEGFEALAEPGVAGGRLGEGQFVGGGGVTAFPQRCLDRVGKLGSTKDGL